MDILEWDERFRPDSISRKDLRWIDRNSPNVKVTGGEKSGFRRIAEVEAGNLPAGVQAGLQNSAGMCFRFATDADFIALMACTLWPAGLPHMADSGSSGLDLYAGEVGTVPIFYKTFMAEKGKREIMGELQFPDKRLREIVLHLPLYNGIEKMAVGLPEAAMVRKSAPFALTDPVVFYGSSITQGACASRPGNMYPALLCRQLNLNMVDLGFSGCAKGEASMAKYIAGLPMAALVIDYDYNAPDPKYLERTHEPFFRAVRAARPELPIILVSKPDRDHKEVDTARRLEIITQTYKNALKAGDRRVWFVDGGTLFDGPYRDSCTVDGCHPNDLGFARMAQKILPVLKEALQIF